MTFKICVLGPLGVGKTNLIMQYIQAKKAENNPKAQKRVSTQYDESKTNIDPEEEVIFENVEGVAPADVTDDSISISDVEKFTFLYKNNTPVIVELWDTVGQEKFNNNYIYT